MPDGQGLGGGEHEGPGRPAPVTAALYRRWHPSISSGPAGLPPAVVTVAMITGSSRSVVIAYPGSKPGPGPIRETACGSLPGSRIRPYARAQGWTGSGCGGRGAARSSRIAASTSYSQGLNTKHCPGALSGAAGRGGVLPPRPSARVVMRHPPGPSRHPHPCPRRRARRAPGPRRARRRCRRGGTGGASRWPARRRRA